MHRSLHALFGSLIALGVVACTGEIGGAPGSGTTTSAGGGTTSASSGTGGDTMTSTGGDTTTMTGGAGGATMTGGTGGVVPTAPYHLVGRFDESDPTHPKSSWSGTTYRTRVSGTSLSVTLGGASGVLFEIEIDGKSTGTFKTAGGEQAYSVASGLAPGEHDIVLVRRNEGFFGDVTFVGFDPGAGALVPTPWPYLHRMEMIGDSLTAGYGIEGDSANCNFSGGTESFYGTYGAIAGRNLKIAVHGIAYSGKGVFQNYGGDKTELMPELWRRTLTSVAGSDWDFSKFTPDAVVVNLGTNDFSASLTEANFEGAYTALLQEVRQKYPAAMIFCVTWAHWGASKETWVKNAMGKAGDADLRHVQFSIDPADGYGCDYHTNLVTNAKLGAILTKALQDNLGW